MQENKVNIYNSEASFPVSLPNIDQFYEGPWPQFLLLGRWLGWSQRHLGLSSCALQIERFLPSLFDSVNLDNRPYNSSLFISYSHVKWNAEQLFFYKLAPWYTLSKTC